MVGSSANACQDRRFLCTEAYTVAVRIAPITLRKACAFVAQHRRHHPPPRGHKWSLAVEEDGQVVGVAICGRPVARGLDDNTTVEVLRVCVLPGVKNACSILYGAARRVAREMGFKKIVTY